LFSAASTAGPAEIRGGLQRPADQVPADSGRDYTNERAGAGEEGLPFDYSTVEVVSDDVRDANTGFPFLKSSLKSVVETGFWFYWPSLKFKLHAQ